MVEKNGSQIPENLRPMFEAVTAHQGVRAALKVVASTPAKDQSRLLTDPIFRTGIFSILDGLDECRRDHALEIVGAFAPEVRPEAHSLIINESN
jgi:hypothetical protein